MHTRHLHNQGTIFFDEAAGFHEEQAVCLIEKSV